MLNIVTGKINSGKTTRMIELYKCHPSGDGFVSSKNMRGNMVHSYDILHLKTNEKRLFVIHQEFVKEMPKIACQIGPYLFLQETLDFIYDAYRNMIKQGVAPLFIDEIGMLELHDQAFHDIFKELLESNSDIYAVIREDLIDDIIQKYSIKNYKMISHKR